LKALKSWPDESAMELEAAVAELRGKSSSSSMELEEAVRETRSKSSNLDSQLAKAQGMCPTCGEVIHPGDRFCSNCGEALEEQVA
jgi:predicted amidophosphoribosyltransferase